MFVFLKLFSWQTLDITSPESEHILKSLQHLQVTLENFTVIVLTDSLCSSSFWSSSWRTCLRKKGPFKPTTLTILTEQHFWISRFNFHFQEKLQTLTVCAFVSGSCVHVHIFVFRACVRVSVTSRCTSMLPPVKNDRIITQFPKVSITCARTHALSVQE